MVQHLFFDNSNFEIEIYNPIQEDLKSWTN